MVSDSFRVRPSFIDRSILNLDRYSTLGWPEAGETSANREQWPSRRYLAMADAVTRVIVLGAPFATVTCSRLYCSEFGFCIWLKRWL